MDARAERRRVKLRAVGGSSAVTLPKQWLKNLQVSDSVDLVHTDGVITIEPPHDADPLESDSAFPAFLAFLAHDALVHPAELVPIESLTAGDMDLFAGVVLDD